MDTEAVQTLARNLTRLRQESLALYAIGKGLVFASRALRAERRGLSHEHATQQDASNRSRIRRTIARRLRSGRLPYESAAILHGAPGGVGRICDGCDRTMTAAQLVMAVPMADTFVYLHAGCYVIWNEERTAAKATPAA